MNITPQNILIGLLVFLGVIFLGVVFSDGECVLQLVGLCEKNESLTFKGCISQLLGSSEDNKHKTLTFLGIGMGGVLVALQALASHKRAKAMEDAANAQAKATEEQAKANQNTEQGQRQERLKNAIEHLGNESVSVRLGGAYELFHLAKDTEEAHETEDLSQTVLDILCAHIRETTGKDKYQQEYKSKPSEEVQSLLTLLFVQEHEVFRGLHINLQGSWLNGARLGGARLEKAVLTGAKLQEAILSEARLREANLRRAELHGANLSGAQLYRANFFRAKLHGAYLILVELYEANLSEAELYGADLYEAKLHGAYLIRAQLHGVASGPVRAFEERMRDMIGRESDLSDVIFAGGLTQNDVDSSVKGLSGEKVKEFQEKLEPHIDQPISHELPENSGAITGTYTTEEAEKWIAKYNEATKDIKD